MSVSDDRKTRVISAPGRAARGAWRFINPRLKAGRIPFTRTVLVMQFVAALVFVYYTLVKKDVQLPFTSSPYYVEVLMPDAKGLQPKKQPAVGVAGVTVGKVVEAKVENGQARLRLRLDHDLKGKIFADATAFVRPTSVLQTLIVNITPGDPSSGPLPDGEPIPSARTQTFVSIDQLTGILDPGTQAQVQVLLHEAASALTGREPEIRAIFAKLGRLTDNVTPLAQALAERRRLLSSLTVNTDKLFTTLGERGDQLAAAVRLGSQTLEVTANREPELADAVRELAPTLQDTQQALDSSRRLADTLIPALDALDPVVDDLEPTADQLTALAPELSRFVDAGSRLIETGRRPVHLLAGGLRGQAQRVRRDQIPALRELAHLSALLNRYRNGVVETAVNLSGAFSTVRRAGLAALVNVVDSQIVPSGLGLGAREANQRVGNSTRMARMLAKMLEYTCRDGSSAACLLRFTTAGLPVKPLLGRSGGGS
jgi:virulence factor Mce-like protein